jgi:hypothetical protein
MPLLYIAEMTFEEATAMIAARIAKQRRSDSATCLAEEQPRPSIPQSSLISTAALGITEFVRGGIERGKRCVHAGVDRVSGFTRACTPMVVQDGVSAGLGMSKGMVGSSVEYVTVSRDGALENAKAGLEIVEAGIERGRKNARGFMDTLTLYARVIGRRSKIV